MRLLIRIAFAATVGQTACQQQSDGTGDAEPSSSISVPESEQEGTETGALFSSVAVTKSEWPDFVASLDRLRIVPEVNSGKLVSILCFYVNLPQAAEIGLVPGDHLVAINGTPVGGRPSADAADFLSTQLERSAESCSLSMTVEHQGTARVLTAHCRD